MNFKKIYSLFIVFICIASITSCSKEGPCDDVTCPEGEVCVNGICVDDGTTDPCDGITCPEGQICISGECEDDPDYNGELTVSGEISSDATWTKNYVYKMNGRVVVPNGVTLTIEAGTIIKGLPGNDESASALIIARGGKIMAEGTATEPIVFTADDDNIEPGQAAGTNLSGLDNQLWGGLIILGYAPISAADGDTEAQIEGIPPNEEAGKYGGDDANDSSGVLRYVSVRHGGVSIGDGNEINGITLGGVGAGTIMENIEVAATLDDGIEFFGGTVNVNNAIVSWQGDDGIDIDQNYSGTVDNWIVAHGGSDTDEAVEIDGPEGDTYTTGKFSLINGTCIAFDLEKTNGGDFKSKAQGTISGVSWRGYERLIKLRSSWDPDNGCIEKGDAAQNLITDCLVFMNSEVVSATASAEDVIIIYSDDDPGEEDCFNAVSAQYQMDADAKIIDGNNIVSSNPTLGADTDAFDGWTLASARGWYN